MAAGRPATQSRLPRLWRWYLVASSDRLACHSTNHNPRPILSGTSVDPRAVWEDGVHRCPSPTLFSDKLRLMPPSLMPPNRDGFVCVSPWPFDDQQLAAKFLPAKRRLETTVEHNQPTTCLSARAAAPTTTRTTAEMVESCCLSPLL
jgi:hypothetical protein